MIFLRHFRRFSGVFKRYKMGTLARNRLFIKLEISLAFCCLQWSLFPLRNNTSFICKKWFHIEQLLWKEKSCRTGCLVALIFMSDIKDFLPLVNLRCLTLNHNPSYRNIESNNTIQQTTCVLHWKAINGSGRKDATFLHYVFSNRIKQKRWKDQILKHLNRPFLNIKRLITQMCI